MKREEAQRLAKAIEHRVLSGLCSTTLYVKGLTVTPEGKVKKAIKRVLEASEGEVQPVVSHAGAERDGQSDAGLQPGYPAGKGLCD